MNHITDNSIANKVTIATFINLLKAFDILLYDKLFTELEYQEICNNELKWFTDYLSNRRQCVDLDGELSPWIIVEFGVPQGSILGPILFLIYANNINIACSDAEFTKFADNATIITSGISLEETINKMSVAVNEIDMWFKSNKLNLNPSKTRFVHVI